MKHAGLVITSILALALSACGDKAKIDNVSVGGIAQEALTKADFEAYLKVKKIPNEPGNRLERAQKTFLERNAIAEAITKEPVVDKSLIEAELRDFRNELLITRYFEKFMADKVSDEEVKKYYEQNKEKFAQRRVQLADILLRLSPTTTEQEKSVQFKKAVEVYNKAKSGGAFAGAAAQYSEDPITAKKGGDLGWVQEVDMERPLADKVFAMKKGEVSEPISTTTGYHIVQLLSDPVAEKKDVKELEASIKYRIQFEAKGKEMERLLAKGTIKELK